MNNKYFLIASVLGIGLMLGGCGATNKVSLDANKGEMIVKTDEGNVKYNAGSDVKMPEDFPKELIIGKNSKVIMTASTDKGITLAYYTNSTKKEVFDNFLKLTGSGWKKEVELNTGDGMMLSFSKGVEKCLVTIGEETIEGKLTTQVSIVLDKE